MGFLPYPNIQAQAPDTSQATGQIAKLPYLIQQQRAQQQRLNLLEQENARQGEEHNLDMMNKVGEVTWKAMHAADTPEGWEKLRGALSPYSKYGVPDIGTFDQREEHIAEGDTIYGKQRDPVHFQLGEIYDKSGRPQKGVFDPVKGSFSPVGQPKAQTGGISFTTPDGSTIEIGGEGGNASLGKTVSNTVQTKAINASEVGARINKIMGDFKPEYQTLGEGLKQKGMSWTAKIDPKLLSSDQQRSVIGFSTFKSGAISNINSILNELSGAAVSPQEAVRLRAAMPDPGSGVFDGDDPITFKAKADRVIRDANAALARYRYYQAVGIPNKLDEIPLSDVKQEGGQWYVKGKDGLWRSTGNTEEGG